MTSVGRTGSRRAISAIAAAALLAILAVVAATAAGAAQARPPSLETVGPAGRFGPGSGVDALRRDRATTDPAGAFIYRKGRYTPLDTVPDQPTTAHLGTNDRGLIVGSYLVDGATLRGFLRNEWGDYTTFDAVPDAALTAPFDINDRGTVVGSFSRDLVGVHGFLRRPNGEVKDVEVAGASATLPTGLNDRGAVVGTYADADGEGHGFLLERGIVTPIDPPDAKEGATVGNVQAFDINDRGQIVGFYPDRNGTFHGFLYHVGRFTRLDPPDATDSARSGSLDGKGFAATAAFGINNRGQVVGQYVDAAGVLHGYMWQRRRGFRTIDPPRGGGTVAADINDHGQIVLPAPGSFNKGDGGF
jgi:probable HAF family extracellular repeat protein